MPYTVFALGSGQAYLEKKRDKNINTHFYEACKGPDALLLDGPKKLGGAYDPKKVKSNIEEAKEGIKNWLKDAKPDANGKYVVNLTGFSRGAVTCLMIANELQKMTDDKQLLGPDGQPIDPEKFVVNIYAEDPVAGFSDKRDPRAKSIPPIVKNYVATLQTDERRRGFKPQDLSRVAVQDLSKTNVTFLPLYGNHSESNKVKSQKTKHSALINHNLKYTFLKQHGTRFEHFPTVEGANKGNLNEQEIEEASNTQLLEYYAKAQENRSAYQEKALKFQTKDAPTHPGKERSFNQNMSDYVEDRFFVNIHHRQLMKKEFPKAFNYFFEKGRYDKTDPENTGFLSNLTKNGNGITNKSIESDLKRMQANNPKLFDRLIKAGKVYLDPGHEPRIRRGLPSGALRIERCEFLKSLNGESIKREDQYEEKLDLLKKQVTQMTYQYQRRKSEALVFSERGQFERAKAMRQYINATLKSDCSNKQKFERVLNHLERNFIELKESGSKSKLAESIESLLKESAKREYRVVENPQKKGLKFGLGKITKLMGQGMQVLGRIISPFICAPGELISSLGNRIFEIGTTGPKPWKYSIGGLLGVVVGGPLYFIGESLKVIGKGVDWIGAKIKLAGEENIKASGAYQVKQILTHVPAPENTNRATTKILATPQADEKVTQRPAVLHTTEEKTSYTHTPQAEPARTEASSTPPASDMATILAEKNRAMQQAAKSEVSKEEEEVKHSFHP